MNFSPEKIFIVGIIALVVLGPNRLPHVARSAGRMLAELRRMSASVQNEVTNAISEPRDALNQAVGEYGLGDMRTSLTDVRSTLRNTVNEVVNGVTGQPSGTATTGSTPGAAPGSASALSGAVGSPGDALASSQPGSHRSPAGDPIPTFSPPPPDDPTLN